MAGYLENMHLIPANNLIEIRYEDFVQDRLYWLREIYRQLDLGDFSAREQQLKDYIDSIEGYEKHHFSIEPALKAQIDTQLGFSFTALGYEIT